MRQGLCCGTPLPDARIEQALARGFSTFRANAKPATDLSQAQFAKYPCDPLWIIGVYGHTVPGVQQTITEVRKFPNGSLIELGNEPNLGDPAAGMPKLSPYDYAAIANDTRAEIEARGMYCYYGAVSNINPDGQKWLKEMLGYAPWIERVSVHRYPYKGDQNPARSPYGSRGAEMTALQTVLNGRRVLVTETGIMCPPVSESEQLAYLRQEVDYWRALPNTDGVIVWVEGGAPQESYGLREGTDGRWRPAGAVFMQGGEGVNCNPYVFNVYDGDPANDEKIPNARVNCRPDGGVETIFLTDGAGNATVYLPPGPPYTIRVSAPGYLEYSWHGLLQQTQQTISLQRVPFADKTLVMSDFCNLQDVRNQPIFSSCYAAMDEPLRLDWLAAEQQAGGTHYVLSIQTGYPGYAPVINYYTEGRMAEWLGRLDEVIAHQFVPVVFLSSGDAYPGEGYLRGVLGAIPSSYYDKCVWVCGWECVAGGWSSKEYKDGNDILRSVLGPGAILACHLTPGRLSFSSNPVEPDDPWQGDEMACWREWGWRVFDVFLYQSEPWRPGMVWDPNDPGSPAERAKEVADRVLPANGGPDWFAGLPKRPVLIAFETVAYWYIRGQGDSEYAKTVADNFKSLGYQGFGNGIPHL